MYFDAVLDSQMEPLFNGTPQQVKNWLKKAELDDSMQVCVGKTLQIITVNEYLA